MDRVIITFDDGSIGLMEIIDASTPDYAIGKTNFMKRVVSWRWGTLEEAPTDRYFRDAWVDTGTVTVDMPKARNIQRDKLRIARASVLADLDIAYQRADEANDQQAKQAIASQKQKLRDVTNDPRIEAATTADALKLLTLDALVGAQT